ncbi:MAG: Holliday junction resolvase RuvX [Gammaproteobacteria bacterium]|nr:Holliday junction resolvase RuvX [Gammaproteobacteria bacterium]CAJ2376577.1 MAG: Putative pre-16S rRNA nuclease [Arenicellales bacterium IbO2]MDA7962637.1 Holliday junction resolvase RuvX [Gammaproteobacteria bacterium]MDA7970626.1 Holliday junction resolvase RuvX [Gammaproteobacteria bacterium]MDA7971780.1 Holliday junction resolvase RuvX [Gammaproteobacteria bacterium]
MPESPDRGRVLGLDFGLRRIGVATGSSRSGGSQALTMLRARDGAPNWGELGKLIDTWKPEKLLVGLPLNMNMDGDGAEGDSAKRARGFGAAARRRFGLEVEFVDERLTTRAAENLLAESAAPGKSQAARRRKHRDSLAAELIVRAYLERGAHA